MSEGIEELHNKIMYLEDRLNKLNEQQQQQTKKDSHIFDKCKCEKCGKTFGNKYILKTHIAQKHSEAERERYKCEHCGKSFLSAYYLKYHLQRLHHHEEEEDKTKKTEK
jgi:ABC-type sugar transport system ATPase subunit